MPEAAAQPASERKRAATSARAALWQTILQALVVILAVSATWWLTLYVWHTADADVREYAGYAQAFWLGHPPFAALPREYPPLALAPFSLTLFLSPGDVLSGFGLWMAGFFVAGYLACVRFAGPSVALRYAGFMLIAGQATLLARYDLVPALVSLAALFATQRRHFALAYVLLAAGILLKWYPLVLLPPVVIAHVRDVSASRSPATGPGHRWVAWRALRGPLVGAAACLALVLGAFAVAALRNPTVGLSSLAYAIGRPVQVESAPATVLWLATFVGVPARYTYGFGSDVYASPLANPISAIGVLVLVAGSLWLYRRQLRGEISFTQACLVALSLILLTSKVFSTQYLLWVLPLAAMAGTNEGAWWILAGLTCLDYPLLYPFNQPAYRPSEAFLFMVVLALRNALLGLITLQVLLGSRTTHALVEVPADGGASQAPRSAV
jgi:hypothetical protein